MQDKPSLIFVIAVIYGAFVKGLYRLHAHSSDCFGLTSDLLLQVCLEIP